MSLPAVQDCLLIYRRTVIRLLVCVKGLILGPQSPLFKGYCCRGSTIVGARSCVNCAVFTLYWVKWVALSQQIHKGQFCVCRHNADTLQTLCRHSAHTMQTHFHFSSQNVPVVQLCLWQPNILTQRSPLHAFLSDNEPFPAYSDWPYRLSDSSAMYWLSYSQPDSSAIYRLSYSQPHSSAIYRLSYNLPDNSSIYRLSYQLRPEYWTLNRGRGRRTLSLDQRPSQRDPGALSRGHRDRAWGWVFILV